MAGEEEEKKHSGVERGGKHMAGMARARLSSRGMKNSTSQTRRGSGRLLRQREWGCAGTTNAIIFMPALLFVRTGLHLRTWVYWLYDTRRAFGVDKRQTPGSHYPSQIDFSFIFPPVQSINRSEQWLRDTQSPKSVHPCTECFSFWSSNFKVLAGNNESRARCLRIQKKNVFRAPFGLFRYDLKSGSESTYDHLTDGIMWAQGLFSDCENHGAGTF